MGWTEKFTLDGMAFYLNTETEEVSWAKPEALMTPEEIEENQGEWVWVPHPTDMWQEARVQKRDEDGTVHVLLSNGSLMQIPPGGNMQGTETGGRKQHVPLWELKKSNLRFLEDDLVMLDPVNEAFIIRNLAQRYSKKTIYTWVGAGNSVLVSVNPYQNMGLYGNDQVRLHRDKPPNKPVPPHVFDIANDSYDSMAFEATDQSILISGESGAGKTEATKQCLKYLAGIAGSDSNVEEKVLVANPLLEAFGNAKTIRNINSSRFGKWMEVFFNKQTNKMQGSRITNYLLERSRVVHQQKDERNYHIFYQLCVDSDMVSKYSLEAPTSYRYLSQSGCIKVPQIDDQKEFNDVKGAMDLLEFSPEEKESVLQLTAAVLWLGNIEFSEKMMPGSVMGSEIKDGPALNHASKLLNMDIETLKKALLFRSISAKGEVSEIPFSPERARTACDSLAMGVYGKLFSWMVGRVNDSLGDPSGRFIGILDIFGFEIFDNNSFEQLCINYANEKLQQLFNKTTFKEEEELYKSEGIDYTPIVYIDNQSVLDLVEEKPIGILPVLDDECLIPEGSDQKFMTKIENHHSGKDSFQTDTQRRFENGLSFEIIHYAGVVKYDASAFMIKNVDTVYPDMYQAIMSADNELLKVIYENSDTKIKTLSHQFRGQLATLMDTLYTTESRFIRCIKPNNNMSANQFVSSAVIEQLRYSGVFEAVNIRKTGFPFRYTHKRFVYRYSCINQGHKYKTSSRDAVARAKEIFSVSKQNFSEIKIGNSMILYKANEYKLLKLLRNLALEKIIPKLQGVVKGGINRRFFKVIRKKVKSINAYITKGSDYEGLSKAIEAADPNSNFTRGQLALFSHTQRNMGVALKLKEELENWLEIEKHMLSLKEKSEKTKPDNYYEELKAVDKKVEDLIERQDAKHKKATINFYKERSYRKPILTKTQKKLHATMKELIHACILGQLDTRIDKAIIAYDRDEIVGSLEQADELGHDTPRLQEGRDLLAEFEKADGLLKDAVKLVSKTKLEAALARAAELKQTNEHTIAAKRMLDLGEQDFVQAEYERAQEVGDETRKIHREIRLMEFKYQQATPDKYDISRLANYRDPDDFGKAKFMSAIAGKGDLPATMKVWTKKQIPTSLTVPQVERDAQAGATPEQKLEIKQFKQQAKDNFKNILIYMGDKAAPDRETAASELVARGIAANSRGDNDTLKEMYLQLLKQLTNNPTASNEAVNPTASPESASSYQNGLTLLAMMLSVFPPSTAPYSTDKSANPTFDDTIVMWINSNIFASDRKRFMSALNNVKYGPKATRAPTPSVLRNQFAELIGKYSLDAEADSGPEVSNIPLYLK